MNTVHPTRIHPGQIKERLCASTDQSVTLICPGMTAGKEEQDFKSLDRYMNTDSSSLMEYIAQSQ